MEDTRIITLYARALRGFVGRFNPLRSGVSLVVWISIVLLLAGVAVRLRGRGHLTRIERRLGAVTPTSPVQIGTPRPGGEEALVLTRPAMFGGAMPEFLSTTLLPGLGMNVLQLTALLPEKGEVPLLIAPTLDELAASEMASSAATRARADDGLTGAFLVPWAGALTQPETGGRDTGPYPRPVTVSWHGQTLSAPLATLTRPGYPVGVGGLLSILAGQTPLSTVLPDGGEASAVYLIQGNNPSLYVQPDPRFAGFPTPAPGWIANHTGWLATSKTRVKVSAVLSSRSVDLTVVATNVGESAEPMSIGWIPRFVIPSGLRQQVTLHMPAAERLETRPGRDGSRQPTGRLLPVAGTPFDFTARGGVPLGSNGLDETYTQIHQNGLDAGPIIEMRDPASNYGLRITLMSLPLRTVRLIAPADVNYVSIIPQFNVEDPFGKQWNDESSGMQILKPGETVTWKIRLELFSPFVSGQPQL